MTSRRVGAHARLTLAASRKARKVVGPCGPGTLRPASRPLPMPWLPLRPAQTLLRGRAALPFRQALLSALARKPRAREVGNRLGPAGPGGLLVRERLRPARPCGLIFGLRPSAVPPGLRAGPPVGRQNSARGAVRAPGLRSGSPRRPGLGAGCGSGGHALAVTASCGPASLQVGWFPTLQCAVRLCFTKSCQRLRAVGFQWVTWGDAWV